MDKLTLMIDEFPAISLRLREGLSIGREGDNDFQIQDPKVSRYHCQIEREGRQIVLRDLDSSNGTYVNEERVSRCILKGGEKVRVGSTTLIFEREVDEDMRHAWAQTDESGSPGMTVIGQNDFQMKNLMDLYRSDISRREFRQILERLSALFEIGNIINVHRDSASLLQAILKQIILVVQADRYYLLLRDEKNGDLRTAARYPEWEGGVEISRTILKTVLEEGKSILSSDTFHDGRFKEAKSIITKGIKSVMSVPLRSHDKILGVLHVDSKDSANIFSKDDLKLLTAIGINAGIAIENLNLYENLKNLFRSTVRSLVAALEANDPYTGGHSVRVANYSRRLAECLGLSSTEIEQVELAAYLHDIGKIGIPDTVLKKPDLFTSHEVEVMRDHPVIGYEILSEIEGMEPIARMVRHHHERFDGRGYPDGLAGDQIPLGSRIMGVVDAFDAMTTDRPYRKRLDPSEAYREIVSLAGTQLDPEMVKAFENCLIDASPNFEKPPSLSASDRSGGWADFPR